MNYFDNPKLNTLFDSLKHKFLIDEEYATINFYEDQHEEVDIFTQGLEILYDDNVLEIYHELKPEEKQFTYSFLVKLNDVFKNLFNN